MYISTEDLRQKLSSEAFVRVIPNESYNYAYDLSFVREKHKRYSELRWYDQKYWILLDGTVEREKYECFLRYNNPLTLRHLVDYEHAKEVCFSKLPNVHYWLRVSQEQFSAYYIDDENAETVIKLPHVRKRKPHIIALCDVNTQEDYSESYDPDSLGLAEESHITQIDLQHSHENALHVRKISENQSEWTYMGQEVDDRGVLRDIYDIVRIEEEPEKFVDTWTVHFDCKPERILIPKIVLESPPSREIGAFKYWLSLKKSLKCVSFKVRYDRPVRRIRHFAVFLEDFFRYEHYDLYRKELYQFRIPDKCNPSYEPLRDFFFACGNALVIDYSSETKLKLIQIMQTSVYYAKVVIDCVFSLAQSVPYVVLPFFHPFRAKKRHFAKVICMKW